MIESLHSDRSNTSANSLYNCNTPSRKLPACTHRQTQTHTHARTHAHTHTHPFNGPFSGTTQVSHYQRGKTNLDFTEARDSEWQCHQLGHMQVCTLLQTDNHVTCQHPTTLFFYRCPSCCPTNSVKALKTSCQPQKPREEKPNNSPMTCSDRRINSIPESQLLTTMLTAILWQSGEPVS